MTHLKQLEQESIHIIREVVAEFRNPVMLYSVGKDSAVMIRLAQKAFHPGRFPFPLMHVDTGYKFPEMYRFRDSLVERIGARLIVESNTQAVERGTHPAQLGNDKCCQQLKTRALLDAIAKHRFDAAFGGARRDEEKSRAKERFFSVRDEFGQWDPKNQRPELWNLYNADIGERESVRIFPLSNWTELDVWQYIKLENIPLVPLYFSQSRQVIELNGITIPFEYANLVDPERKLGLSDAETKQVGCRFRSLGCIPCTGAVVSDAQTIDDIIQEVIDARRSERENRIIDLTSDSSMEQKKREGYF
ncbi:MAG: sulfate adenylyltransferase subunit CysD [Gammaproteobacteria bacterium]|nr:sulfate adenylyltransferase subunit CysD [Gammaproteobacteria bacterium]MCB1850652.1 sulfate adenylyltransferase subunit CysD [Gammaproteobacteria bacterium]MCP5416020.1 sulfate adenylyltransferase subunit CysD [Chromatiaceae bacterium]